MSFSWEDIWRLVKRWWWLAVIGVALAGGTSYYLASKKPNIYAARATLMVGSSIYNPTPTLGDLGLSNSLAMAYAEMAYQPLISQGVLERLGLDIEWFHIASGIQTSINQSAQLLNIGFLHTDPEFAALAANAVAEELIAQSPGSQQVGIDRAFIRDELADTQAKMTEVETQIGQLRDAMVHLTSAVELGEASALLNELEQIKLNYSTNYAELASLLGTESPNSLTLLQPATPPYWPIAPNPKKEAAIASVAGLALAIGAVFLLEFADDTLRIADAGTESVMGLPVLGTVPRSTGDRFEPASPEADIVRQLRTKVLLASPRGGGRSFLVTSGQPKDGKTFVAVNLGVALAGRRERVVLVDADLRSPSLHERFDQPNLAGLADLLEADKTVWEGLLPQLLRDTDLPNLTLLSAGHIPLDPSILLTSPNVADLIELLCERFDYVIIDSPPVLVAPDTAILATLAKGTLFVLSQDRTSRKLARRSIEALKANSDTNVIGVALNRASMGSDSYQYRYYGDLSLPQDGWAGRLRRLGARFSSLPLIGRPADLDLIPPAEAAQLLGVRPDTIMRWCKEGRVPAVKQGFRWWVKRGELHGTLVPPGTTRRL